MIIGIALFAMFILVFAEIHNFNKFLLSFDLVWRLIGSGLLTTLLSIATGIPVSLAMNLLRDRYGSAVAWMWGVSSAFNALGAAAFVPLGETFGISFILVITACLYLIAAIVLAIALSRLKPLPVEQAAAAA